MLVHGNQVCPPVPLHPASYPAVLQVVVNFLTFVRALRRSPGVENLLPGFCPPRDTGKKTQIPLRLGVNHPAVRRRRTRLIANHFLPVFALPGHLRAAPLKPAAFLVKTIIGHGVTLRADGDADHPRHAVVPGGVDQA